MHEYISTRITF